MNFIYGILIILFYVILAYGVYAGIRDISKSIKKWKEKKDD
jgi:hypothetical protein